MTDLTHTKAFEDIQASFQRWQAAWNGGDLEGFLDSYWQSDQTRYVSGGRMMMGFDTIAATYRERYLGNDAAGMGQMTLEIQPDLITDDEAIIFGTYQARDDNDNVVGHGVFMVHLRNINGAWKIVSDHAQQLSDDL